MVKQVSQAKHRPSVRLTMTVPCKFLTGERAGNRRQDDGEMTSVSIIDMSQTREGERKISREAAYRASVSGATK
jgi:hypothetical protein